MAVPSSDHSQAIPQLLPADILSEIFEYCVWNEPSNSSLSTYRAPWVLGKICHRWRTVCLSTPSLWVNIPVLQAKFVQNHSGFSELLKTSLTLSTSRYIPNISVSPSLELDANLSLFHVILPHFHRCISLSLDISGTDLISRLQKEQWDTSALKKLRLKLRYNEILLPTRQQSIEFFSKSHSVTDVEIEINSSCSSLWFIRRPSACFNLNHFKMPWAKVERLKACYLGVNSCLQVFLDSPNLKEAHFYCPFMETSNSSLNATPFQHHNLRSLALKFSTPDASEIILLDGLSLPNLMKLHITQDFLYHDRRLPLAISALIARSRCSLLEVSLSLGPFDDMGQVLVDIFESTCTVRDLELRIPASDIIPVLRLLSPNSACRSTPFLARLRHFEVRSTTDDELPDGMAEAIIQFIESRTNDRFSPTHSVKNRTAHAACVDFLPLEQFTIDIEDRDDYMQLFETLEGWNSGPSIEFLNQMASWRSMFHAIEKSVQAHPFDKVHAAVEEQLCSIESAGPIHGRLLKKCDISANIAALSNIMEETFTEHDTVPLTTRLLAISDDWTETIASYLASPHWEHVDMNPAGMTFVTGYKQALYEDIREDLSIV